MSAAGRREAIARMAADGATDVAIAVFTRFYDQLERGASGLIAEDSIEPVDDLPRLADLDSSDDCQAAFARTAVVKLNGGLGTSMGMDRAKSLLTVKDGLTFLDVIVRQVLAQRAAHDVVLPLVFLDSFRTHQDTLAALARYEQLPVDGLPIDFRQSREPKLAVDDLTPIDWPRDRQLEWCPPGHAEVFPALQSSGVLDRLLEGGFRYAFISNSDNLGAIAEPRIAGWLAANSIPFALESCRRTPADRKGGHLATRRADQRLILRETAQTSPADMAGLEDLDRHRYCNTNNLWIDLRRLREALDASGGVLDLPLIRNVKTVDPSDPASPQVVQIESAMGAAVQVFDGARSVLVERDRFVPVKTTNDLLVLRSDLYTLDDHYRLTPARDRISPVDTYVELDPSYYRLVAGFDARFPQGPPSLSAATRFVVRGDATFEAGVVARGKVEVDVADGEQLIVAAGTVLGAGG
jgi:UTP--glucose-1-phosphate uridylyltransferase